MRHTCANLTEVATVARRALGAWESSPERATVVGLVGDLGAGKTTFVQALARELGVREPVTSPTFVLEKRYPLSGQAFRHLVHLDAYRLNTPDELIKIGWADLLAEAETLVLVEWADKITPILPRDAQLVKFKFVDETTREITL
jgi:tRNA threonylcarbamoyladenosine biosynthesis protein TsaE